MKVLKNSILIVPVYEELADSSYSESEIEYELEEEDYSPKTINLF